MKRNLNEHGYLTSLGHAHTHFYAFKLLRFCALTLSNLSYAHLIFHHHPSPNTHLFTAIITVYAAHPTNHPSVLILFRSPAPTSSSSPTRSKHARTHAPLTPCMPRLLNPAFSTSPLSKRRLLTLTPRFPGGGVESAVRVFDEMPERDVPSWNALIAGCTQNGAFSQEIVYGKCGSLGKAREVFGMNPEKGLTSWNSMINCFALHGQSDSAIAIFEQMVGWGGGVRPDEMMGREYGIEPRTEHYGENANE
ncbi:hypothetical protein VNO80_25548 [Phaseolus coccineus]|uniref:Pentatricopeptide repeat-containing protein n=1 Tax=Phaseolus coccineus TaxID=3886 RepID=A0AAN9LZP0_PHACN